jgi:hypothetical protein
LETAINNTLLLLKTQKTREWNPSYVGGELVLVGGGRKRRKGVEGEYSANTVYTCKPVETVENDSC